MMKHQLNDSVYEFYRPHEEFNVEFVAFHGLRFKDYQDAYEATWQVGTRCWLREFIPDTFPEARILSVSYDSCAKESDEAGRMSLSNIGKILVQDIIHLAKVGQRGCPVVLIGYCLGGLVVKQLCTEAEKQYEQAQDGSSKGRLDHFLTNVRAIVSLDTPHAGSNLEAYLRKNQKCVGPVLEYLSNSHSLGELNRDFDSLVLEREWQQVCCWYCWDTKVWDSLNLTGSGLQVVQKESAKRGQGRLFCVAGDHSGKALSTWSQLDNPWKHLHDLLWNIIDKTKIPNHPRSELNSHPASTVSGDREVKQLNDSLYEMYRPIAEKDVKLELIFFPGSLEEDGYETTWMAKDNKHCWLQTWLPEKFPDARVLAVSYGSSDEEFDLTLFCENLIQNIIIDKTRRRWRPLILVGHCFGGLVIKELCNQVEEALGVREDGKHLQEFLENVRGIVYYATSHSGYSSDYKLQKIMLGGGNGQKVVEESDLSDKAAGRLNTGYMRFITSLGWKELALGETRPTQQGIIVDEFSASNGIQRNSFFPVAEDHFSICKPKSPSSNNFKYLVHFIRTTLNEAQYWNMNVRRKKRRGIALIVGMEEKRPGSEADRRRLEAMADYLQFDPKVLVDKSASQLPYEIKSILERDVKEEDECILCCVNAHGIVSDGIHFIFDNEDNGIELLADILKPIADCTLLAGKPKVFVVNSCRSISGQSEQQEQDDLQGVDDCLLMYSTKLDTEAWRRESGYEKGTLFVTELAYHISLLYRTVDVQDIFKMVEEKVPELAARNNVEQFPVLYSSLRKRLSWRPR